MSDTNKLTLDTYERYAKQYVDKCPIKMSSEFIDWFDDCFLDINTSAMILEIGAGSARIALYLESKGFSVERTDASKSFVDLMISNGDPARQLNVLTDEIKDEYDVIFAEAVFLHFTTKELDLVLKKIFESLRLGGSLFFTLKKGEGNETESKKMNGPRYFQYWNEDGITDLLSKNKYSHIKIDNVKDFRKGNRDWLMVRAKKTANPKSKQSDVQEDAL